MSGDIKVIKAGVAELWQSHFYRQAVAKIEELRPTVPRFDYKGESNIEEIKFKLAQLELHQTIISILKPEAHHE